MRKFASAVSLGLISALIVGVFLVTQLTAATVKAELKFEPSRVDLGAPAPKEFEVTLRLSGKHKDYNVSDIDAKTILVEEVLSPKEDGNTFGWRRTHSSLS